MCCWCDCFYDYFDCVARTHMQRDMHAHTDVLSVWRLEIFCRSVVDTCSVLVVVVGCDSCQRLPIQCAASIGPENSDETVACWSVQKRTRSIENLGISSDDLQPLCLKHQLLSDRTPKIFPGECTSSAFCKISTQLVPPLTPSNNCRLQEVLKTCANIQSLESLYPFPYSSLENDFNDVYFARPTTDKMISPNPYSLSGFISNSSCASEDAFTDIVLEEDNRISLAYENLCTIPRRLADKFAAQTKFLDLSHNNFQNLKFLSFFEDLHTLILDRNSNLDVNTFPYLPNLKILWLVDDFVSP